MRRALAGLLVAAQCSVNLAETGREAAAAGERPGERQAAGGRERFLLTLPLSLDGAYLGDITAGIDLAERVEVQSDRLLELLAEWLEPALLAALRPVAGDRPMVPLADLRAAGLDLRYDPAEIALVLDLAPGQRAETSLSLGAVRGERPEAATPPAEHAAGLGIALGQDFVHESDGEDEGMGEVVALASGFITMGGFDGASLVFEGGYDGSDPDNKWQRGNATLIKDDWARAIRYSAWDVRNLGAGFQEPVALGGVAMQRLYAIIQPFANIRPGGNSNFVLERTSDVDVLVNGAVVQSLRLAPGQYDIRDFPVTDGFNDVQIVARDAAGRRQIATLSVFSDTTLLGAGIDEFEVLAGMLQKRDTSTVEYTGKAAATGFYRRGLTDLVTVGGDLQASDEVAMAGATVGVGTPAGIFGATVAGSLHKDADAGAGLRATWRLERPLGQALSEQYDVALAYLTSGFAVLGDDEPENDRALELDARYRRSFASGLSASIGAGATLGRGDTRDEWRASLGLARIFGPVSAFVTTDLVAREDDDADLRLFLSFTWRFGERYSVRASFDTRNKRAVLEGDRRQRIEVNDWASRVRIERSDDDGTDITGDLNFIGNRAEVELGHVVLVDDSNSAVTREVSRYRVRTGVAFADGGVALGRDPSGGFAILDAHPTLDGRMVRASDRFSQGDAARTGPLGPALVPLSQPYQSNEITVTVDDAPLGYDLGRGGFELFPGARSGYRLTVGSAASNIVLGRLETPDGRPVALATGRLEPLDGKGGEAPRLFSNRAGRFVAEAVAAGRYAVFLDGRGEPVGQIDIPESNRGLYEAGTLILPGE